MNLDYTYTVISVNKQDKSMTVLYSCVQCEDITVDMPFPGLGVALDEHVQVSAPVEYWALQMNDANPPAVGAQGALETIDEEGTVMEYTYEVLEIDSSNRSMLVIYRSNGCSDITVGVRTPFINETLETVIRMYAPIPAWQDETKEYSVPVVGDTGSLQANIDIYTEDDVSEPDAPDEPEDVISVGPVSL